MSAVPLRRAGDGGYRFEFRGVQYTVDRLGPYGSADSAWSAWRSRDGRDVGDFRTLADLRAMLDQAFRESWPDLFEKSAS